MPLSFSYQGYYNSYSLDSGCGDEIVIIPSTFDDGVNGEHVVDRISAYAFYECANLKKIIIPGTIKYIDYSAFLNCYLLEEVLISNGVLNIASSAFSHCTSIKNIIIPDSVTGIGDGAFAFCESLENITIGKGVTSLADVLFANCISIVRITIPNNITSIGAEAFNTCEALSEIILNENITYIGQNAFRKCTSLENVYFLGNKPNLGQLIFYQCSPNLKFYRYSTKSNWSSTLEDFPVLLIDSNINKSLQVFGYPVSDGKISIEKQNLGTGFIFAIEYLSYIPKIISIDTFDIGGGVYFFRLYFEEFPNIIKDFLKDYEIDIFNVSEIGSPITNYNFLRNTNPASLISTSGGNVLGFKVRIRGLFNNNKYTSWSNILTWGNPL